MKKNYFSTVVSAAAVIVTLSGCASIEVFKNWQTKLAERKQFQVRTAWVHQSPKELNLAYRKINRMSPVLYTDKNHGEMLIEGNSFDGVVAYSRYTGKELWRLQIVNGVESSMAIIKETLFFGANDGQFYSIEAATGKINWTFPTRIENLSEPLLHEGNVYFLAGNNSLYALDALTGKQLWLYSRQDPNILSVRGGSKPAYKNDTLFVGFSDGYMTAINAKSGQMKWEVPLNKNKKFRDIDANPILDAEFVYALGFDDHLYCLKQSTGDLAWKADKGGYGGMMILGDRLYYGTTTSEFIAVDKNSGKQIWSYALTEGIATAPSLYRGLVVFGESQGDVKFLDSGTGKLIGSFGPGKGVLSPIAVDEKKNYVFFISGEANVYALEVGFKFPNAIPYLR